MNITAITDRIFKLAQPLAQIISEYTPTSLSAPDKAFSTRELAAAEDEENAIVSSRVLSILAGELKTIRPGVPVWRKEGGRPAQGEEVWVVNPYSRRLMGLTFTSIALQQGDTVPLGVFFRWDEQQIFTGEQDDGAYLFEESLHVSEQGLTPHSSYIFYLPVMTGIDTARTASRESSGRHSKLTAYLEEAASQTRPAYNGVMENIPGSMIAVASGALDFTMASGFHYPDVAAAIAIVEAAGGRCTDFSGGRERLYNGNELFCSNPAIHQEFLAAATRLNQQTKHDT